MLCRGVGPSDGAYYLSTRVYPFRAAPPILARVAAARVGQCGSLYGFGRALGFTGSPQIFIALPFSDVSTSVLLMRNGFPVVPIGGYFSVVIQIVARRFNRGKVGGVYNVVSFCNKCYFFFIIYVIPMFGGPVSIGGSVMFVPRM